MISIRIHGRGGQGAVTAAQLLAIAAYEEKKCTHAFPFFGTERRGSPVESYVRIDCKSINTREQVYEPDYVLVMDPTLLLTVDVSKGLKKNGIIIINTKKQRKIKDFKTVCFDVSSKAIEKFGKDLPNTGMLSAFIASTKVLKIESLKKAVEKKFPENLAKLNNELIDEIYKVVK